jgi:hypothetical protein
LVSCERFEPIVHKAIQNKSSRLLRGLRRPEEAIQREKEIKRWRRQKKNELVEKVNPRWNDLRQELFGNEIGIILSKANR